MNSDQRPWEELCWSFDLRSSWGVKGKWGDLDELVQQWVVFECVNELDGVTWVKYCCFYDTEKCMKFDYFADWKFEELAGALNEIFSA